MERRKFTREFRLEAVRLIKDRGVSYAQASHDLSVHQSQLRSWVKALADDPQHAFERDILKKAAAYFAKEST
jgi:transposase-like protein